MTSAVSHLGSFSPCLPVLLLLAPTGAAVAGAAGRALRTASHAPPVDPAETIPFASSIATGLATVASAGGHGGHAPPVDPAAVPFASIAAAFDAPAESVTERILSVLDGKRTWEATVAYLKPKILAAAPSWRDSWNATVAEILREAHGIPGQPLLLVAFSGGKPYFRSEYTARGISHSYLELALRGEGAFLTALAAVFPDFPDVVFAINYGRQHGSYLVDLAFPGFSRGYSPDDTTDLNAWPINAELLQSCACKELESDAAYLTKIAVPWESREPRAFFRGRPSSPQRWRLAKVADGREDIFDVGVLRVMDKSIGVEHGSLAPFTRRDAFREERRYKFAIYAEGSTAAWRMIRMLASGSAIILIQGQCHVIGQTSGGQVLASCDESQEDEFFFVLGLKPWVHYVPVRKDLSNLVEVVETLRANDTLAREVAANGRRFYEEQLQPRHLLAYAATALSLIAEQEGALAKVGPGWLAANGFLPAVSPAEGLPGILRFRHQSASVAREVMEGSTKISEDEEHLDRYASHDQTPLLLARCFHDELPNVVPPPPSFRVSAKDWNGATKVNGFVEEGMQADWKSVAQSDVQ